MSDPLVQAINAARGNRDTSQLDFILGKMILLQKRLDVDSLIEVRDAVYESLIPLLLGSKDSLEIARMSPVIIQRRLADFFRKRYRKAKIERDAVSLDDLEQHQEPVSPLDVAEMVAQKALFDDVMDVLCKMRHSGDALDLRAYLLIEADRTGTLSEERMREIMGKDVTRSNASTLLNRAKQRLRERLNIAGGGRIGA